MRTLVSLYPRDPFARYHLGCALKSRGEFTNAIVQLEQAVRWLPNGVDQPLVDQEPKHSLAESVYVNLGLAYQEVGNATNAEHQYREALRLVPDNPEVHYNYGRLLLRTGRIAEAEPHLSEAIKLMPDLADAYNCLGIIRKRQNRRDDAMACFQSAVRYDTNHWQAHLNLAQAYLTLGDPKKAIPELRETLRIQPSLEPAQQALAKALAQAKSAP